MTEFRARDAKHIARLGGKPLPITWGKQGVSWNALQMWNASVVLFDPQQDELDARTVSNMLNHTDYTVRRANHDKWIKQILDAHMKGTGYRAFQDGDSTAWPKISRGDVRTIKVTELTEILLAHREQVRVWKLARESKVQTPEPETVETPVVVPDEVILGP
ncbi:MAG: hypothetical protein ACO3VE_07285, partial [Burkholderiaceae bacterium]